MRNLHKTLARMNFSNLIGDSEGVRAAKTRFSRSGDSPVAQPCEADPRERGTPLASPGKAPQVTQVPLIAFISFIKCINIYNIIFVYRIYYFLYVMISYFVSIY